jgi:glycosyltransferase involved in cell wall biosynthesis
MKNERSLISPKLALVVPCFNEAILIENTINQLLLILQSLIKKQIISAESYLFIIDDGSKDDTWKKIIAMNRSNPSMVRGLKFSKNFGHQNALFAGLISIKEKCDISISIDADLQQDTAAIPKFIDEYKKGAEIVFGVRNSRDGDSFFKKYSALFFYNFIRICGVNLIPNHADYRLISKKALAVLALHKEPNLFLRAICNEIGFKTAIVKFDVFPRLQGDSKYSLKKMLTLASQGMLSFSVAPLRFIAILGIFIFALSLLMTIYVLVEKFFIGNTVPGWASTVIPIYLIGGLQILCLGVVGEYMGQIYKTLKNRPNFIVDEEI